jgi:hypothetical protein
MRQSRKIINTGLALYLLSGCATIAKISNEELASDKAEIIYHEITSENDVFYGVTGNAGFNSQSFSNRFDNKGETDFSLGLTGYYHSIKQGEVNVALLLPIRYLGAIRPDNIVPSQGQLSQTELSIVLTRPVFSFQNEKEFSFIVQDEENNPYILSGPSTSYNKVNLRLGGYTDYARLYSANLSSQLKTLENFDGFIGNSGQALAEINQRNTNLKIGSSYQICMNNRIKASGAEGAKYRGRRSQRLELYFDVNILLNHNADGVEYNYRVNEESVSETFYPEDFMTRRRLGFSAGYKLDAHSSTDGNLIYGFTVELGLSPGFYDNAAMAGYFKFIYSYGFGKWK